MVEGPFVGVVFAVVRRTCSVVLLEELLADRFCCCRVEELGAAAD